MICWQYRQGGNNDNPAIKLDAFSSGDDDEIQRTAKQMLLLLVIVIVKLQLHQQILIQIRLQD